MSKNAEAVRIQDDLYHAVNDEWIKNAVIPADKPATGGFMTLDEDVEKLLMADFAAFVFLAIIPRLFKKGLDVVVVAVVRPSAVVVLAVAAENCDQFVSRRARFLVPRLRSHARARARS